VSAGIAAIVLAAGRSSRMAPRNKLLEPVEGRPMVAQVAGVALDSGADPVIVVTGFDAQRIEQALGDLKPTLVHNPDFAAGLSTSLRAGVKALPATVAGALICLGDMPRIDPAVLRALMAAFTGATAICVPVHQGRRGNPVLWGKRYFTEIMHLSGDRGAKSLIARHAQHVVEVEVETASIFEDIDAAADLARVTRGPSP
jgi:molybdenum cofactor cytidylyltransferase